MDGFEKIQSREAGLHQKLTARQMSMIAIGGAIGTGLFLGSKFAIGFAGPGVVVSYAIGGLVALLLMGCLAEMTVAHSTSGSFGAYAEHYVSPLAGFLVRYAYWSCIVLAVGTEVTAVAEYMKFWFPGMPAWVWIGGFSAALVGVNAYSVKAFGSVEYWFSATKVFAIVAFILLGAGVLLHAQDGAAIADHLTGQGGFLPHGWGGVWTGVIISIFSYLSIEMIAVAAGEAEQPKQAVRAAFKATILRLVIFYLLSLSLIVMLVPWQTLVAPGATSPFVTVMQSVGLPYADSILNFIVIVAALSAMNSMLYIATRMLFSLARAGDAPSVLGRVHRSGVPRLALAVSASGIAVAASVYVANPDAAFPIMIALSMFGALFTWGMIFFTHLFFRRRMDRDGVALEFRMIGYPLGTLLGLGLIVAILLTTWFIDIFHATLVFGVPFLLVLLVVYGVRQARRRSVR